MEILVTGAKGMLGTDLVTTLEREHEVIGVDIDDFDLTDTVQTGARIAEIAPDFIIHSAAYTDVDGCESNLGLAYKVNAIGTQNVALACRQIDATMLYISTDFIFDGAKTTPYLEWDHPNPLSVYGASKYAGEQIVSQLLNKYYIVRIAWLYGAHGNNFVKTILRLADERDRLQVVDDQKGSPTYTIDVAHCIGRLLQGYNYGIFHMTNSGEATWFEFAKTVLELSDKGDVVVEPITSERLNRLTKRPTNSVLRNLALELTIGDTMRPWQLALEDFMKCKEKGSSLAK